MKGKLLVILILISGHYATAQFTQKIKADSVRIYNDNCNAELILENGTKNIKGFLYNKGNGRTEFRAAMFKLNDSSYIFGNDTLKIKPVFNGLTAGSVLFYNGTMITQDNSHFNWDTLGKILTVTNLVVTNGITASTIAGTLTSASQPNITSLGTLQSLTVAGAVNSSTIGGLLTTSSQPNITSLGNLGSLTVTGVINATIISGTINLAAQPNITSIGTLGKLTVTGAMNAGTVGGTITTASQPNITSLGVLSSLTVTNTISAGNFVGTDAVLNSHLTLNNGLISFINPGGSVYIDFDATNPTVHNGRYWRINTNSAGNFRIIDYASGLCMYIPGDNAGGGWVGISDSTKKVGFGFIGDDAIDRIMALKPRRYMMKSQHGIGPLSAGFYAQEVIKYIPEAIGNTLDEDGKKVLTYNANFTIPYIVKAVQVLKKQTDARIGTLEQQVSLLLKRIEALEKNKRK